MTANPHINPEDFLTLTKAGTEWRDLDTPCIVIDLARVAQNVMDLQRFCDSHHLRNRPHIKTHKIVGLAQYQMAMGAIGICVQKLGEAEMMAAGGLRDMVLAFNLVGAVKLARLTDLLRRYPDIRLAVVADHATMLDGLAAASQAANYRLPVWVECDSGHGRNGVQSPAAACDLAARIAATPGLCLAGLFTYPAAGGRAATAKFLHAAKQACQERGIKIPAISSGGSPDLSNETGLDELDEYRSGTSIYYDRAHIDRFGVSPDQAALYVHATIVSRPTASRAIIDAGSKSLTSDLLGLNGYGRIVGDESAVIARLDEEHGVINLGANPALPYHIGDVVRIIPNHVCPVSNLFDQAWVARDGKLLGQVQIDARGRVD